MLFKRTKEAKPNTQNGKPSDKKSDKQTDKKNDKQAQKQTDKQIAKLGGKQFRMTVGMKLFAIILCSVLIPVGVTGVITLTVSNSIIENNASQAASETILQTSAKIDATLVTYEQIVTQFVTNLSLHEQLFIATNPDREMFEQLSAQRQIQDQLSQMAFSDNNITAISILSIDPERTSFASSNSSLSVNREERWFQQIANSSQQFVWLHTENGGYTGVSNKPSFAVGRTVRTNYGQDYIVMVEIDQNLLSNQVYDIKLSDSSMVYIVSPENLLLHSDDVTDILTTAALPLPEEGRSTERGESGRDYIVVSQESGKADWLVVGAAPISELTEDTKIIQQAMVIIVIVAVIGAIALSAAVARSMGGPLRKLQTLMMEGAKGNLNVRTDFKSRDEIGQVGQSFNDMMEQIKALVQQTNNSAAEVLTTAQELSGSAKETAHSAREISEATEQIANGASTLASEAERGNELVLDLSGQLQQVVQANQSMGEVASDVHKVSEQGTGYMEQLTEKTQRTEEMTRRMVEKVDQLKERTASIRNLLDMLTQITQQTNILALNASIEASRSGAAGRGFMVIAGEIRKLADESRKSIDVVAEMTEHIQGGIDETVSVMSEAYPMFQEQIASVKDADTIFNSVRERMAGLVSQADQVTEAIEQLEKAQQVLSDTMSSVSAVSEESSAISEEVASSSASQLNTSDSLVKLADKLEQLSSSLTESLKKFKL